MPIREYQCSECGKVLECIELHRALSLPPECCAGAEMRRLLAAPSFQLKGSGWYKPAAEPLKIESTFKSATSGPDSLAVDTGEDE